MYKLTIFSLMLMFAIAMPVSHAMQSIESGVQSYSSETSYRYLTGDLISWENNIIKTDVGNYTLTDMVTVLDQTNSINQSYSDNQERPHVRLKFKGDQLIEVLINQ